MLSDLRESGSLESDADCVMFLYRESDYNQDIKTNFPNVTEFIVAKNRGGQKGSVILNFDGAHSKFYDIEPTGINNYLKALKKGSKNEQTTKQISHNTAPDW